jgi:hypothetical protein
VIQDCCNIAIQSHYRNKLIKDATEIHGRAHKMLYAYAKALGTK